MLCFVVISVCLCVCLKILWLSEWIGLCIVFNPIFVEAFSFFIHTHSHSPLQSDETCAVKTNFHVPTVSFHLANNEPRDGKQKTRHNTCQLACAFRVCARFVSVTFCVSGHGYQMKNASSPKPGIALVLLKVSVFSLSRRRHYEDAALLRTYSRGDFWTSNIITTLIVTRITLFMEKTKVTKCPAADR